MNRLNYKTNNSLLAVPHCTLFSSKWQTISIWDGKLAPQQLLYYNQSCSQFATHFTESRGFLSIYLCDESSTVFFLLLTIKCAVSLRVFIFKFHLFMVCLPSKSGNLLPTTSKSIIAVSPAKSRHFYHTLKCYHSINLT